MDGSPSLVKGHVGTGCNKGLMQAVLAIARSLQRTVYLEGESEGKFTFYLSLFKKSPSHHQGTSVIFKEEWGVKGEYGEVVMPGLLQEIQEVPLKTETKQSSFNSSLGMTAVCW